MTELKRVAIVGSARIPFARGGTAYSDETNLSLLGATLAGLAEKYGLKGEKVDEVIAGAVINHSRDFNIAREALLDAGLSPRTPGTTVQIACGTSLQAALLLAGKIASGQVDSGIAAGSDTVSDSPIVFGPKFQHRLLAANAAKTTGQKLKAFTKGFSFGELAPVAPSVNEPRTGLSMGQHAELMAKEWGISRQAQDALAVASHRNASAAYDEGFQDDLLVQCAGLVRDNNVRTDTSLEKLASLKPSFDKSGSGTLTAGNSTPLTDGASSVLLASEDWAKARGLPILAYLSMGRVAGNDFAHGEGLLMAPTIAVSEMLDRAGLGFADIDYFELHEAFAAQVLCTMRAWNDPAYCRDVLGRDAVLGEIDPAKLNVKGSSLAYGHPFAATGARILGLTAKLLSGQVGKRALISVCTAGGMGVAALVESAA
ncbi:acetyl-CoA C-acetyltransferase [Devosia sp. 63-57]|uniref:acetyl-CoA C-acetyltransferase n=1 Tax=Devosia sp. 63-57 TaxID=1895751 RepID=UPI00086BEA53|nr:acetyl-CoA C-acetyltransferase [Devosia sp. 63-57]ODT48960.1 MAG: acetyl-CoA acetyltransferase [Pelagibacterium sp. SCN 63-126]ODU89353.1 MAG: acetyl-CoA acetyltransferase [Pelagibacterium sp. SCN 63-17]OJX44110.1 MAG: acetyl-CoA acetyltransferase [Devosia sp. 63-57]